MSDKVDIIIHRTKRILPPQVDQADRIVIKEDTTIVKGYNLFKKTLTFHQMTNRVNDYIIFGLSEGLPSLQKEKSTYHRNLLSQVDFRLRNMKTLTIRNPFILRNKTEYVYLIRILLHDPPAVWQLSPGQTYPVSYSEFKYAKV